MLSMNDFYFKGKDFYCEDVAIDFIAKEVGTPCYIYSHGALVNHFTQLKEAFSDIDPIICFAMKANDNLAVLKTLANCGSGFDIVSVGELKKVKKIKGDTRKVVFASVGKTEEEIVEAIKAKILFFNVESEPELVEINRIAKNMKVKAPVALRINPDVKAVTHAKITTGTLKHKFGIDLTTARKIMSNTHKYTHIDFNGIHYHIGSQILTKDPFITAIECVLKFLDQLKEDGHNLKYLDIGGGLGIKYDDERPQTAKMFAKAILPYLKKSGLRIVMEPGRFIAGNAGIFVVKALYLKDNGVKKFLIVDGGMNDLMRPSLYDAYHKIIPLKKSSAKSEAVDVVGPICESSDVFARDRVFPKMRSGDLLAIMSAGAYGYVMASNYNVRVRPPEVIVKGGEFFVCRKRETFNDLVRGESVPNFLRI